MVHGGPIGFPIDTRRSDESPTRDAGAVAANRGWGRGRGHGVAGGRAATCKEGAVVSCGAVTASMVFAGTVYMSYSKLGVKSQITLKTRGKITRAYLSFGTKVNIIRRG